MLRLGLSISAVVVVLDQLAKAWILYGIRLQEQISGPFVGRIEISGVFDLTFVRNFGVSFGLFSAGDPLARWGLVLLSIVISGAFFWWLRGATRQLTALALGLIIGGAIGNMIDRVRFGYVVDFLDFSGLYFPYVFNVADAAITVGAIALMLDHLVNEREDKAKSPA